MKRKVSMVLFLTVLFGIVSAVSVFAAPPPNGRYMAVGGKGSAIMIHYIVYYGAIEPRVRKKRSSSPEK